MREWLDQEQPFALSDLPTRAPWWPWSPWSTGQKIRNGEMTAIREGRRVWVTQEILRRHLSERAAKANNPYRLGPRKPRVEKTNMTKKLTTVRSENFENAIRLALEERVHEGNHNDAVIHEHIVHVVPNASRYEHTITLRDK